MMQHRYRICDAVFIFTRYTSLLSLEYMKREERGKKKSENFYSFV